MHFQLRNILSFLDKSISVCLTKLRNPHSISACIMPCMGNPWWSPRWKLSNIMVHNSLNTSQNTTGAYINRELLSFRRLTFTYGLFRFTTLSFKELAFHKGDQSNENIDRLSFFFFAIAKLKCQLWNVTYCISHSIFSSFSSSFYTSCTYGTKNLHNLLFCESRTMFYCIYMEKNKNKKQTPPAKPTNNAFRDAAYSFYLWFTNTL